MEIQSQAGATSWSGTALLAALEQTVASFEPQVPAINALNVFPVPDGDTGTNMFQTLQAACRELEARSGHPLAAGEVLAAAAHGALMGARGNSGVILYQIIVGLAQAAEDATELDGALLATGLDVASRLAYQAVVKPVEGTILTVLRASGGAALAAAERDPSLTSVLDAAYVEAQRALAVTPDQLPILKQAGVVDAGGQGLVVLIDGLRRVAAGEHLVDTPARVLQVPGAAMAFLDMPEVIHEMGEFGYCTNFVVSGDALAIEAFRTRLEGLGRSMVVVGDRTAVKVHIHSDHPGLILEAALEYGALRDVRIDNMTAQTEALLAQRHGAGVRRAPATERLAVVAVASGEGLADALLGMGAAAVVPGGPTVNPSTEEILRVIERLDAAEIIVLPNDANVIPTARQVERLTDKSVKVVPSTSVPEGISALSTFNQGFSLDENVAAMTDALGLVHSLALTTASRDAEIGGITARKGQFIGLLDGVMRAAGDDPVAIMLALLEASDASAAELLTLFTGEPASDEMVRRLADAARAAYPSLTVEVTHGGQPHYHLIAALE